MTPREIFEKYTKGFVDNKGHEEHINYALYAFRKWVLGKKRTLEVNPELQGSPADMEDASYNQALNELAKEIK